MSPAPTPGPVTWRHAFPQWDLLSDNVPVSGEDRIDQTGAEDRTETILEIASTYRVTPDFALGELYPLVPAGFRVALGDEHRPVPLTALASRPAADVTAPLTRAGGRRLHRTLAQVNAAAAVAETTVWPRDEILDTVGSTIFSLDPEQFYALIDVAVRGRDRDIATDYVVREFHDDLDTVLAAAIEEARRALDSAQTEQWFASLVEAGTTDAIDTHPQLHRPLGLLEVTLDQVAVLLIPELDAVLRRLTPDQVSAPPATSSIDPQASTSSAGEPVPLDRPTLTAQDDLYAWEKEIAARLNGKVLAVEADLSATELDVLLDVYAARYRQARERETTTAQFVRHFPATTVAVLVGMAAIGLENNTYWSGFWDRLGSVPNATDEASFRSHVPALLARFGLDPVAALATDRYVQRLAVHAGIPAASFDRLVVALSRYVTVVSDRLARPFDVWIREPGREELYHQLDAPSRNFIEYGGERGAEFCAEFARIVAWIADDPALEAADVDSGSSCLPEMVFTALQDALVRADTGDHVRAARRRTRRGPTLHLAADDSIVVRLPAPNSHTSAPWTVTLDTTVLRVAPERFARDRAVDVHIDQPTRRVLITHPSTPDPVDLRLYETDQPFIVFTTDGEHLSDIRRLPRTEVVALVPADLDLVDSPPDTPRLLGVFGEPGGWSGWSIHQWDLSEAAAVRGRTGDGREIAIPVGSLPTPTLLDQDDDPLPVLPGVYAEKIPVLSARPWISLPALGDAETDYWKVQYRRAGARAWVHQGDYIVGDIPLFGDPDDDTVGPQLGRFDIRVTGPHGVRFDEVVFVAEGLEVVYDDSLRLPQDADLTPVTATVESCEPALEVFDPVLEFGPADSTRQIRLRNGSASAVIDVRPPRMEFRLTTVGGVPVWSDRRIGRRPEDLSRATLAIRGVPPEVQVDVIVRDLAGDTLTSETLLRRSRSGVLTIPAARLAAAAHTAQSGEVVAILRYPEDGAWEAPIVRFSTVGADVHIAVDGDQVSVRGRDLADDLVLHVWRIARPWAPVLTVALDRGRGELPASTSHSGDIRIAPVVEDPWDPVPPEPLPPRDSIRFSRPADFGDGPTTDLSRFLVDQAEVGAVDPSLPEVWSALALLALGIDDQDATRFGVLAQRVRSRPRQAAVALAAAEIPTADKLALFIRTGLVFDSLAPAGTAELRIDRATLSSEPWLDLLITIADIPTSPPSVRSRMIRRLRDVGGSALTDILKYRRDPYAGTAALNHELVMRSDEPAAVTEFLERKGLVPGGLIDPAARYEAYLALFRHHDAAAATVLQDFYSCLVSGSPRPIDEVKRFRPLWQGVRVRADRLGQAPQKFPWANAPFASHVQALYARLIAHDQIVLPDVREMQSAWARFAGSEPEQTMIDLVIADALVTSLHYPEGRPNPFVPQAHLSNEQLVDLIIPVEEFAP